MTSRRIFISRHEARRAPAHAFVTLAAALALAGCKAHDAPSTSVAAQVDAAPAASSASPALPENVLPPGVTVSTAIPSAIGFDHYDNARFDFALEYPTFVKLEVPSEAQDGEAFNYFERVHMSVHGKEAKKEKSIDELYRAATSADAGAVTSKSRTQNGFVVEHTVGERVHYDRLLTNGKTNVHLHVDYEIASRDKFDKAAKHVVDSLHFGAHPRVPQGPVETTP